MQRPDWRDCFGALECIVVVLMAATLGACASSGPEQPRVTSGPVRVTNSNMEGIDRIVLDFPVGAVHVEAAETDRLRVEMLIACYPDDQGCNQDAAEIHLQEVRSLGGLTIAPSRRSRLAYGGAAVTYLVKSPNWMPLGIEFDYGELTVHGIRNALTVRMSAGDVHIEAALESTRRVSLDVNFGDVSLARPAGPVWPERRWLVGAKLDWSDGPGRHAIDVRLDSGDVTVKLTD